MFYHKLTDRFERGGREPSPYPRGAVGANVSSRFGAAKFGGALTLGAVVLGGFLVTANVNMHTNAPQEIASTAPAETQTAAVSVAEAKAPPAPVAPAPVEARQAPAPTVAKATAPLDMATTGAIGDEPTKKSHPHVKTKKKQQASRAQ